jgi:hypothetical protein
MLVLGALPLLAEAGSVKECISGRMSQSFETPKSARHERLWAWLRRPDVGGKKIMARLSNDRKFAKLIKTDSGVPQRYTIEEHNQRVYNLFEDQLRHFGLDKLKTAENIDLANLIKFTIAVHDIGKPLAVKAGDRALQHVFTVPLIDEVMPKLGFSKAETHLAKLIVDNDVLGELDQGLLTPEQAFQHLNDLAAQTSMSPRDFFTLQTFFYTIDAGSYPDLLWRVFTRSNGKLVPKGEKFKALSQMFEQ